MHTLAKFIILFVFFVVITLPIHQSFIKFADESDLYGYEQQGSLPSFSFSDYLYGIYQGKVEDWLSKNIGFRSFAIKHYNQVIYSLFGQSTNSGIIIGRDGYLFGKAYVDALIKPSALNPDDTQRINTVAVRFKQLQDHFSSIGKSFILIIAPNKAELFSEQLPYVYVRNIHPSAQPYYVRLRESLQSQEAFYIDVPLYFKELKEQNVPVFGKSGVHWNYVGVYYVLRKVLDHDAQSHKGQLCYPELDGITYTNYARSAEYDLFQLLNIWSHPSELIPHPQYSTANQQCAPLSYILIGDSFCWEISLSLLDMKLATSVPVFSYYKQKTTVPEFAFSPIDKPSALQEILSSDIIILAYTSYQIDLIEDTINDLHDSVFKL